jgi:hypothetical protein
VLQCWLSNKIKKQKYEKQKITIRTVRRISINDRLGTANPASGQSGGGPDNRP